jgi:hypothetical protein
MAFVLLVLAATAEAQVSPPGSEDPVARAMSSVERTVARHAAEADRAIAASRLIEESKSASNGGDERAAARKLEQASAMLAASGSYEAEESPLVQDLRLSILGKEPPTLSDSRAIGLPPLPSAGAALSRAMLMRFKQYRGSLGSILEREQLPVELLAVALVESGMNRFALSPRGARGIWQLMPATASRYGLTVLPFNDGRTLPEYSTQAAARYLRYLYARFGDWKLVLAAYNAGEDRVQKILDRGIVSFEEMSRRGYLPLETRKYVPAVMATWSRLSQLERVRQAADSSHEAVRHNELTFRAPGSETSKGVIR